MMRFKVFPLILSLLIFLSGCTEIMEIEVGDSLFMWRDTYSSVGGDLMIDCLRTEDSYVVMLTRDNRTISGLVEFSPEREVLRVSGMSLADIPQIHDLLNKSFAEIVKMIGKPHARVSGLGTPTYVTEDAYLIYLYSNEGWSIEDWSIGYVVEIRKVDLLSGEEVEIVACEGMEMCSIRDGGVC